MQLVLKAGTIIATHSDEQSLVGLYPDCEIVTYEGPPPSLFMPDPRTPEQKQQSYRDARRFAYPPIGDQLDMFYWDAINDTTTWRDTITAIKEQHPKP